MISYDITIGNNNDTENTIIELALRLKTEWSNSKLKVIDLNGGITNRLLACYLEENGLNTSNTLLFRVYGRLTENYIDRQAEISSMRLMKKANMGPSVYFRFKNGICYEYLPGAICDQIMIYDENIYSKIAKAVAQMHLVEFKNFTADKKQEFEQQHQKLFTFAKTRELLKLVKEDYKANIPKITDTLLKQIPPYQQLVVELCELEERLSKLSAQNKFYIVFSHNDLLLGNIVYNKESDVVKFIDYEYSSYNYQAYDIANHFNEFAGVDNPDYKYFPTKEYQLKWLRIYADEFYKSLNMETLDEQTLHKLYVEVQIHCLASHLMWAIWSLVQAQSSQLDFDFVNYAAIRFAEYFKMKKSSNNFA